MDGVLAALRTVEDLRVYDDMAATVDPPGAILGPPALAYDAFLVEPTSARLIVALVVTADERAVQRLLDLLPSVTTVLGDVENVVVRSADPGTWPAGGGSDLPAYLIEIEAALG